MPEWRKLHTKILTSRDVHEMPDDFHRLLWTLLPLGLDREGRGIYNPSWIKSKIMPLRTDVSQDQMSQAMEWFVKRGMIQPYEVDGWIYFYIPTFKDYQTGTQKEAPSHFPEPPDLPEPAKSDAAKNNGSNDPEQVKDLIQALAEAQAIPGPGPTPGPTPRPTPPMGIRPTPTTDADADADADAEEDDKSSGPRPPAADGSDPKQGLLLELTEPGRILEREFSRTRRSKGRAPFRYYANSAQREAYLKVYNQLGSELQPLIVKGLERQRESLTQMLGWLEGCAKRKSPARSRPGTAGLTPEQVLAQLEEWEAKDHD